ncbi:hypothetical protein E0H26_27850 [Micromonospora zingiberis]|uniref:DUF2335 domain-containing protein n=1 Tax=Micromonospora zingiberis TaxID=2053011 RepID=A0A4V2LUM9_9ACTN|nr:hypothetical protein [Micromonospora zingiberis]TCB89425.1 hypothetical protein E0H26_27850 [Micromonospora zingiberis]
MSEQSVPVSAQTAWPSLLPPGVIAEWKKVDPEAPKVLLEQIAADAKFMRRMAWSRLAAAVLLFAGSLALSAYFVQTQAVETGTVTAGAGTITVVTILLTGRPPIPKKR